MDNMAVVTKYYKGDLVYVQTYGSYGEVVEQMGQWVKVHLFSETIPCVVKTSELEIKVSRDESTNETL